MSKQLVVLDYYSMQVHIYEYDDQDIADHGNITAFAESNGHDPICSKTMTCDASDIIIHTKDPLYDT